MKSQRQIISRIPLRGMNEQQWSFVVEKELIKIWACTLSEADRKSLVYDDHGRLILDRIPPHLFQMLDSIILHQAQTLGWRIELSKLVQFRKSEWDLDPEGPEKHKKFGLAVARSARIMQRKELPPIEDPDQRLVKQETVEELRLILKRLRAQFVLRRKGPTQKEVHGLFSEMVSDSPKSFPHLGANLERWLKFFGEKSNVLSSLFMGGERTKPAMLYDEFLSWATGWNPDSLRQTISRL
jgi:hypothetical protein